MKTKRKRSKKTAHQIALIVAKVLIKKKLVDGWTPENLATYFEPEIERALK